jgi:hypothetical protein
MGPIVLLTGVLITLYALASMFAGGSVASASRGVPHTRRYAWVTGAVGVALIIAGLAIMIG